MCMNSGSGAAPSYPSGDRGRGDDNGRYGPPSYTGSGRPDSSLPNSGYSQWYGFGSGPGGQRYQERMDYLNQKRGYDHPQAPVSPMAHMFSSPYGGGPNPHSTRPGG